MRFLHHDDRQQILLRYPVISPECDTANFVFLTLLNFVGQENLAGLVLESSFDLDVEVAFFLEIIAKILPTLLDQVTVNGSFRVNWNQLLLFPCRQEGDSR